MVGTRWGEVVNIIKPVYSTATRAMFIKKVSAIEFFFNVKILFVTNCNLYA